MKSEEKMINLTCGVLQILLAVIWLILKRSETEEISYEILGSCVCWTCVRIWRRPLKLHTPFGGLLLGISNTEKSANHQKKKFFVSNSVEALIQFKKEHHGSSKLHVPLGWRRRTSFLWCRKMWGGFSERNLVYLSLMSMRVLMKKKNGWRGSRRKRFYVKYGETPFGEVEWKSQWIFGACLIEF